MTDAESGIISKAIGVAGRTLGRMPPAFTVLLLLNIVFVGTDLLFRLEQQDDRTGLLAKVLDKCLPKQNGATP